MKKEIIIVLLILAILISGCNSQTQVNQKTAVVSNNANGLGVSSAVMAESVQKVEVIHFHGNSQCTSCIAVGALAEETIKTYYGAELLSGKVTFAHINFDLPENKELAQKYGVTGSSLWIGIYDENGFHKEENANVWYKIQDKPGYMTYLKGLMDKRLQGDYT
jgi:hypothetical protein